MRSTGIGLHACAAAAILWVAVGCATPPGPALDSPADPRSDTPSRPSVTAADEITSCITGDEADVFAYAGEATDPVVAIMGEGPASVIVSSERSGSVCPWLPLAERLVDAGYEVALYQRLAGAPDDDAVNYVVDMTALMRDRGSEQVFLVGGSLGGGASLDAAASIQPPVDGLVNLSGGRVDSEDAAAELTVPLLQIVAASDSAFPRSARRIDAAATQAPARELIVLPGRAHASDFFAVDQSELVLDLIVEFLDTHRAR